VIDRLNHSGLWWIAPAWIFVGCAAHTISALIRRRRT